MRGAAEDHFGRTVHEVSGQRLLKDRGCQRLGHRLMSRCCKGRWRYPRCRNRCRKRRGTGRPGQNRLKTGKNIAVRAVLGLSEARKSWRSGLRSCNGSKGSGLDSQSGSRSRLRVPKLKARESRLGPKRRSQLLDRFFTDFWMFFAFLLAGGLALGAPKTACGPTPLAEADHVAGNDGSTVVHRA